MNVIENYVLPEGRTLGLKVVHKDGRPEFWWSPEGFRWNLTLGGETEAPDWDPKPQCGGGLHVWRWAQGELLLSKIWYRADVVWMAVEYKTSSAVNVRGARGSLDKVPKCRTIAVSSDRKEVVAFIQEHTPEKFRGPVLDEGIIEVEEGDVEVGEYGIAVVRGKGNAIAGDDGWASCGDGGFAEAGDFGAALAGKGGTASTGACGMAAAGEGGTLCFCISSQFKNEFTGDNVIKAVVGENGIKPNTFYWLVWTRQADESLLTQIIDVV